MESSKARRKPLVTVTRAVRCFGISAGLLILCNGTVENAVADNSTRTLKIHHTHTKEDITVTFKRNGRYDENGLAQLNRFLRDWRNDQQTKMAPELFDVLWEVYQEAGGKEPIQIISAYRSPATNSMLRSRSRGVAQFSQHMLGKAIDFNIPDASLDKVRAAGLRLQRGGVGFYPGSRFVHVDVGSVRHWPRMSPDQLARVFPNGRTVHVPSDGKPLPGYELALADLERRGSAPSRTFALASNDTSTSGKKRGLLSRLFNVGEDDEEEATPQAAAPKAGRARPVIEKTEEPEAKPTQVAAMVPLPRNRPNAAPAPKPELGGFKLAANSPADIVQSRGLWTGKAVQAAVAEDPARPAQRMVWQAGPQGRPIASSVGGVTVVEGAPVPRPRPALAMASATPETTASVAWPAGWREERIPSDMVLAYAAQSQTVEQTTPSRTAAAPMGAVRPAQAAAARAPAPARAAATQQPARNLVENPWLRGVILSPSIKGTMDVATTGGTNYRELASLMRKPNSALSTGFTYDPAFDSMEQKFTGAAVEFLPVVLFGRMTASLN